MLKILLIILPIYQSVLQDLNSYRLRNVTYNYSEQAELDRKAQDLERLYAHDHKGYGAPFRGEVIAMILNPEETIEEFRESEKHWKVLRDPKARSICFGMYQGKYKGFPVWFVVIRTYE